MQQSLHRQGCLQSLVDSSGAAVPGLPRTAARLKSTLRTTEAGVASPGARGSLQVLPGPASRKAGAPDSKVARGHRLRCRPACTSSSMAEPSIRGPGETVLLRQRRIRFRQRRRPESCGHALPLRDSRRNALVEFAPSRQMGTGVLTVIINTLRAKCATFCRIKARDVSSASRPSFS